MVQKMPIIAIAPCAKPHDYEESVRRAGGEVRMLDYATDRPADVVASVDGILLPGGADVLPSAYGEATHEKFEAAETGRDEFELELARLATEADVPLFAICRGIQVLNVACGGSLIQDISSQVSEAGNHNLTVPPHLPFELAHEVWVEKDSLLAQLLRERLIDGDSCEVNSRHHQAINKVAPGLRVTATAPDGIVEAIEDPAAKFCLGVQWHPENFWRTGEFRALFEGFLGATS
jgi:putative glutamine amidotransferase